MASKWSRASIYKRPKIPCLFRCFLILLSRKKTTFSFHAMEQSTNAEQFIAYAFTDRSLLKQALVAAGSHELKNIYQQHDGANKALAMVGDALIRLIIVDQWYSGQGSRGARSITNFKSLNTDPYG